MKFEDVRFAYKEQEVLHGVSLELGEGTLTALVGESGRGKSTLAKLLVHYYDINSGKITLGGQDITDMSIEALNDKILHILGENMIEFKNVTFAYSTVDADGRSMEQNGITGLDLTIQNGEFIVLTGGSGCGKRRSQD